MLWQAPRGRAPIHKCICNQHIREVQKKSKKSALGPTHPAGSCTLQERLYNVRGQELVDLLIDHTTYECSICVYFLWFWQVVRIKDLLSKIHKSIRVVDNSYHPGMCSELRICSQNFKKFQRGRPPAPPLWGTPEGGPITPPGADEPFHFFLPSDAPATIV